MVSYYKCFLPELSRQAARLHTRKTELGWTQLTEEELADFYSIKKSLLESEALAAPNFADVVNHPFILSLDWSCEAMCVTVSQVHKCQDGQYRRRLLFCTGRKNGSAAKKYSSHKGELSALMWGLKVYDHVLKYSPFLCETDSMSVKYIQDLKTQKGVYARWFEILGNYSFTISHQKVIVEDTISRCPQGLRSPLPQELAAEQDYESEGPIGQDLEAIALATRQEKDRAETICNITGKLLDNSDQSASQTGQGRTEVRTTNQMDPRIDQEAPQYAGGYLNVLVNSQDLSGGWEASTAEPPASRINQVRAENWPDSQVGPREGQGVPLSHPSLLTTSQDLPGGSGNHKEDTVNSKEEQRVSETRPSHPIDPEGDQEMLPEHPHILTTSQDLSGDLEVTEGRHQDRTDSTDPT